MTDASPFNNNHEFIEDLLFQHVDFGLGEVKNQVLAAFLTDDDSCDLSQIRSVDEFAPLVCEFAELEDVDEPELFVEQILDRMRAAKRLSATLTTLQQFSSGVVVQAYDADTGWHEATSRGVSLADQTCVVLLHQFGVERTLRVHKEVAFVPPLDAPAQAIACELCGVVRALTKHHLTPRSQHSKLLKRGQTREFLNLCANICRPCHSAVHRAESNESLARDFAMIEALRQHPQVVRWINYWKKR